MAKDLAARITLAVRDRATAPLRAVRRQFSGLRGVITSVGTALATYFSARAIGGFFTSTVREASLLETGLARVGAVTQGTAEEMDRLEAAALEMGGTTRYSAAEAAGAMESLARAGLSTTETIQALPSVLALAEGQSIGLAEAAQLTTRAANGMGLEFSEAARIADVLTAAAANSDTTVTQLGDAFGYAAPTARAAGLSLEDTVAIIGKLSDSAIDGSRAGTTLNNMLSQFIKQGSGFRTELSDLGITTDDFIEALYQLEQAGAAGEDAINALSTEAGPGMRALLAQGIDSLVDLGDKARNSMGDAEKAAARMDETLEGALENLRSGWRRVKIFLGEPLLDRIAEESRNLAERLQELVNNGSLDRLRELIVATFDEGMAAIKRFMGSLGTTDEVVGKFTAKFETATKWVRRFGDLMTLVGQTIIAAYQGVNTVVSAVLTVVVGAAAKIAGALSGVVTIMNKVGLASDAMQFKAENVSITLDEMAEALRERTAGAAESAAAATNNAADALERLATGSDGAKEAAEDTAKSIEKTGDAAEETGERTEAANQGAAESYREVGDAAEEGAERAGEAVSQQDKEIDEHKANLKALRDEYREALKAGASMQELGGILREITREQKALRSATTGLEDAFEQLGIKSQAALEKIAEDSRASFEAIRASGTATTEDLRRAYEVYAQRAIAANDGVVDSALRAQGAQLGIRTEVDETGQVIIKSANESSDATDDAADKTERLGNEWKKAGKEAKEAGEEMEEAASSIPDFDDRGYRGRASGAYDVEASSDKAMLKELLQMERESLRNAIGSGYEATRQANRRNISRIEDRLEELADEEEQRKLERLRREKEIAQIQKDSRVKQPAATRDEARGTPSSGGIPARTVRLEFGRAKLDVPEEQGEQFLRELERHQSRAG